MTFKCNSKTILIKQSQQEGNDVKKTAAHVKIEYNYFHVTD
jgi:hypothetical protein